MSTPSNVFGMHTRRSLLLVLWLAGLLAIYAIPESPTRATVVVAEPALRAWVEEIVRRDPELAGMELRSAASGAGMAADAWLGLAPPSPSGEATVVARSPYVVATWAASSTATLSTSSHEPQDWAALRGALAESDGPRPFLLDPRTRLGQDALLLLSLAHYGASVQALPTGASTDPSLRAWLRPFYQRQTRLPADEASAVEAFVNRTGPFDVAVLPEHEAVSLLATRPTAQLTVRYPAVNATRTYVLRAGSTGPGAALLRRLQAALLGADAQAGLAARGFRPTAALPASGPFADPAIGSHGVRWDAHWLEVTTLEVAGLLPRDLP